MSGGGQTMCPRAGASDGVVVDVDDVWAGVVGGGVREGEHAGLRGHRTGRAGES